MLTQEALSRSKPRPRTGASIVLLTACCGVFFSFASIVVFTFGVFLKPLQQSFQWSRGQLSLGFTLAALTVGACSPMLGHLLDRLSARRVILPCTIIYALAFASLSQLTPHLWHFYAVFVLLGIVGNGTTQLGYARVVSTWFNESRGRALAAVMAGSGLGSMVFPLLAQQLISRFGWRIAYAAIGTAILFIAVPLASLFLFESDAPAPEPQALPRARATAYVWSAPFLAIVAAQLLFSFATNALNAHWVALLTDRGAAPAAAAFVVSIAGFATLSSKLGTGYFLDRFRAGRVAATMFGLSVIGFALVLAPYTSAAAILSAVLIGAAMGAESDTVPYLLTRYFGLAHFGVLYGYTWLVYAIAAGLGPLVMGTAFDRTGSYRTVLTAALCMVAVAAAIFAALPPYAKPSTRASALNRPA